MQLTSTELLDFLRDELGVETGDIEPDTILFSTGVIDSFGLVTLMTFLENRNSIRIKPTDVNLDNFDSVERILNYVERTTQ